VLWIFELDGNLVDRLNTDNLFAFEVKLIDWLVEHVDPSMNGA